MIRWRWVLYYLFKIGKKPSPLENCYIPKRKNYLNDGN